MWWPNTMPPVSCRSAASTSASRIEIAASSAARICRIVRPMRSAMRLRGMGVKEFVSTTSPGRSSPSNTRASVQGG